MNRSARFRYILFPVLCLFTLLMFIPFPAHGAERCRDPLNEADIQSLCQGLVRDVQDGRQAEAVENAAQAVSGRVAVGDTGTFGQNVGCWEVSRIQITLFYETGERVIVDEFIDLGDKADRQVILVKSCQLGEKENIEEFYADASVQIFLKESQDRRLGISSGKQALAPGESAAVTSHLLCGTCPMRDRTVTFNLDGPGSLTGNRTLTDEEGAARTEFKAGKPGVAIVTSAHEELRSKTKITTAPLWNLRCTFHFRQEHPEFDPVKSNYNDKWRSETTFENIPLFSFVGIPPNMGDETPSQQVIDYYRLVKHYESPGTFTDYRFTYYNGMELFRGKPSGQPMWILEIGLTGDTKDLVNKQTTHDETFMALHFKMERNTVLVHYPSNIGIKTPIEIRFRRVLELPSDKILAGAAFSVSFEEEAYSIRGGTIDFIPNGVSP